MLNYPDYLGVYRVGEIKTHSKLEAIELHNKTGIHPHWDFNEAVFDCYDWTKEPSESILELYRQRAQQLRDQYDYIVLLWSGGADSHTIMRSFIDNDIKLDEIVSYVNYDASDNKADFLNSEIFFRTLPQAKTLANTHPWMKFRLLDQSQWTVDTYNNNSQLDWIYKINMLLAPNALARDGLGYKVKEWADMIAQGKKLCLLWGVDKPRLAQENNKYVVRFLDIVDNCATVNSMMGMNDYRDELFYWTPSFPKILIKQGHMIKSWLEKNWASSPFMTTSPTGLAYKEHNGTKHWLNNHGLHNIIYPQWDISTFDSGKPASIVFSPRDQWFFGQGENSDSLKIWKMGINKIFDSVPDYWKNDHTDVSKGLKACWSKSYFLE